jgi:NAD(P)-dependent dehydrogenase (short-subunit alcohol dehydrogenase family)
MSMQPILLLKLSLATLEDWNRLFDVNGKGVFLCYKYAAAVMIEQGRGGRIIGACSLAGKQGTNRYTFAYMMQVVIVSIPGLGMASLYSATKFTVRSLTQSAGVYDVHPHR